jgi:peptidoglycan/LPS O-acetylase OafA/YrhL
VACLAEASRNRPPLGSTGSWEPWVDRGRHAASGIGLLAVCLAAVSFDASLAFPGWRAALPAVGTAMVVAAGPRAWPNRALARPALVSIGLISYPLYLWHWPMLAILPSLDLAWSPSRQRPLRLMALGVAFAAAYATYRFVEQPVSRRRVGTTAQLCGAMNR